MGREKYYREEVEQEGAILEYIPDCKVIYILIENRWRALSKDDEEELNGKDTEPCE